MRTTITLAICILSIWHPQSADSKSPTDLEARIDALFANVVGDRSPGFAVLVSKDGRVIVQKGYGLADLDSRRRISPETKFRIGSITKQFTAVAILLQVLLNLGDGRYAAPVAYGVGRSPGRHLSK